MSLTTEIWELIILTKEATLMYQASKVGQIKEDFKSKVKFSLITKEKQFLSRKEEPGITGRSHKMRKVKAEMLTVSKG